MKGKYFNLKGMIKTDMASCLPLEPFMMSISDILEGQGYAGLNIKKLKTQLIEAIKLNVGDYKMHVEKGITYVHGVTVDNELFVQAPSNSIGLIDHVGSVEWFNLINGDSFECHNKGKFMYLLGLKEDEDGDIIHGYMDGNQSSRYNDPDVIEMRKEFMCIYPCLRPEDVNVYLMEKYQCYVSVMVGLSDYKPDADKPGLTDVDLGYRTIVQQSVYSPRPLFKDVKGIVDMHGFYNFMSDELCDSPMGAYSLGFNFIKEKVINDLLRVG